MRQHPDASLLPASTAVCVGGGRGMWLSVAQGSQAGVGGLQPEQK